ncbi:type I-E CRISPR-associated protein Cas7/Cse4/CasC [Streptomyces sp. NRRL F-5702]|uniref:type I-E CRISPR-associated protein Cas7/Cse4/CasC n=1 Tax=Streptomyces sp. NRRL F-5702 TaxID=1463870 RepID=UPI0004CC7583|nr:type I-E CRISPR-associated protein Cas7/Cse4/CasC [Streptomyces sp. NRRL F-5702]
MSVFIGINVLHPFPLSNLNRDDLNSPKVAMYGGVERSRVSSQSTKRTTRHKTEEVLGDKALRTRRVPAQVAAELQARGWDEEDAVKAGQAVALASGVRGLAIADAGTTTVMLYLPEAGISALADLVEKNRDTIAKAAAHAEAEAAADKPGSKTKAPKLDKETAADVKAVTAEVRAILASRNASIAAFGRMLANTPEVTVDGAVSVAHSITTHATAEQADFFTAVDDVPGADHGSAHMGNAPHTSGTFYKHATVNVGELIRNLEGDTDTARAFLTSFLREFSTSVPQAKKNSTAPFTPPALAYLTVRTDQPINLATAFEAPVTATDTSGYTAPSIAALTEHVEVVNSFYGTAGLAAAAYSGAAPGLEQTTVLGTHIKRLDDLVEHIVNAALDAQENAE